MKKAIFVQTVIVLLFLTAMPAFAQSAEVDKIENFIKSIIGVLTTVAGLTAVVFFVIGGFGYITSSGNPEHLDRSKKTILYSAVGLAITGAAYVLSNIVAELAKNAFGS